MLKAMLGNPFKRMLLIVVIIFTTLHFPVAFAQETVLSTPADVIEENIFKAKIINISNTTETVAMDNLKNFIQTYTMTGLEGKMKNKIFTIENSEFNVLDKNAYKKNDVFLVAQTVYSDGTERFGIVDYARESGLYFLAFLFAFFVIIIGRKKGLRALISLIISIVIIIAFIVPQIINGVDPLFISIIGGLGILLLSLYVTNGFKMFTHLAALSISLSLFITVLLSEWFSQMTKLTGTAEENVIYLAQFFNGNLNTRGLLLAGFIIGALGVLDDMVVNQISVVEELHKTDKKLPWQQLFQKGLKIGVDHIGAIVNSLFLAYMGASLPLLLFFSADTGLHLNSTQMLNLEIIGVEIVRMLTGSIALILAVPIATFVAAIYLPKSKHYRYSGNTAHAHVHTKV